jgi:hypothetical protein
MADHVYAKSSYRYLDKFYKKYSTSEFAFNRPVAGDSGIGENEFIYWTCWLQGMETAPAIVKACINSVKKMNTSKRVIVITYKNLDTYISLPEFIITKHKQGYISAAHFADILRTYLLYIYGGVWFDATVFFTQKIPMELLSEPLFFFRGSFDEIAPVSNWFIIAAVRGNPLLFKLLCILCEYWRKKNKLIDYFIFYYLLWSLRQNDSQCAMIFNKMAYRNNFSPHFLQKELLFLEFDAEKWEKVQSVSFCHKLTWKPPQRGIAGNSFFQYIAGLSSFEPMQVIKRSKKSRS